MSLYLYSYWTYANYVCEENIVSDSYEVINNYNYNELLNIFSIQWLQDWKWFLETNWVKNIWSDNLDTVFFEPINNYSEVIFQWDDKTSSIQEIKNQQIVENNDMKTLTKATKAHVAWKIEVTIDWKVIWKYFDVKGFYYSNDKQKVWFKWLKWWDKWVVVNDWVESKEYDEITFMEYRNDELSYSAKLEWAWIFNNAGVEKKYKIKEVEDFFYYDDKKYLVLLWDKTIEIVKWDIEYWPFTKFYISSPTEEWHIPNYFFWNNSSDFYFITQNDSWEALYKNWILLWYYDWVIIGEIANKIYISEAELLNGHTFDTLVEINSEIEASRSIKFNFIYWDEKFDKYQSQGSYRIYSDKVSFYTASSDLRKKFIVKRECFDISEKLSLDVDNLIGTLEKQKLIFLYDKLSEINIKWVEPDKLKWLIEYLIYKIELKLSK